MYLGYLTADCVFYERKKPFFPLSRKFEYTVYYYILQFETEKKMKKIESI